MKFHIVNLAWISLLSSCAVQPPRKVLSSTKNEGYQALVPTLPRPKPRPQLSLRSGSTHRRHSNRTKLGNFNLVFQRGEKLEAIRAGQTRPTILRDKFLSRNSFNEVKNWNLSPDGSKFVFSATPEDIDFFDVASFRRYVFEAPYNSAQRVMLAAYGAKEFEDADYALPSFDPSGQKMIVTSAAWETFDHGPQPMSSHIQIFGIAARNLLWDSEPIAAEMPTLKDPTGKFYAYSLQGGVLSPDGNQVVCLAESGYLNGDEGTIESREKAYPLLLVHFNLRTRQGRVLSSFRKFFSSDSPQFAWRPNSSGFVFVHSAPENNANLELYSFDLQTQKLVRLTHDAASDFSPTWTPDGRLLFWIRGKNANIYNEVRAGANQIMRAKADGTSAHVAFRNVTGALRLQAVAQLPAWERYHGLAIEPLAGKYSSGE